MHAFTQVIDRHFVPLAADLELVLRGRGAPAPASDGGGSATSDGSSARPPAAAALVGAAAGGSGGSGSGGVPSEVHLEVAKHLLGWLASRG
jgi:hypothetical protein